MFNPETIVHFLSALKSPSVSLTAYTLSSFLLPTNNVPLGDMAIERALSTSAKTLIEKPLGILIVFNGRASLASVNAGTDPSSETFNTTPSSVTEFVNPKANSAMTGIIISCLIVFN